jgi:hypothetical protein
MPPLKREPISYSNIIGTPLQLDFDPGKAGVLRRIKGIVAQRAQVCLAAVRALFSFRNKILGLNVYIKICLYDTQSFE